MRVLLDANILISYLLKPDGATGYLFAPATLARLTLLFPEQLLIEFVNKAQSKPYLADRIHHNELERLVHLLREVGELIPPMEGPIPQLTRDPKDDYLLAYTVIAEADYLVTGDQDLLILKKVLRVKIVTPGAFQVIITSTT